MWLPRATQSWPLGCSLQRRCCASRWTHRCAQSIKPPYVCAYILLDGADIAFLHLILECPAEDVRMGMRVEAVWCEPSERRPSLENIKYMRPNGEPDALYDSFKEHL